MTDISSPEKKELIKDVTRGGYVEMGGHQPMEQMRSKSLQDRLDTLNEELARRRSSDPPLPSLQTSSLPMKGTSTSEIDITVHSG